MHLLSRAFILVVLVLVPGAFLNAQNTGYLPSPSTFPLFRPNTDLGEGFYSNLPLRLSVFTAVGYDDNIFALQERKLLEEAKTRLSSETMERTMPQKPATIRDPAEPPSFPSRPKILLNLSLGAVAGLVLGVAFAFFLEYLDTSVKTMDEVEKLLDLPVLAVIPKGIHILPQMSEDSSDAEAYRILKTNVDFSQFSASHS